MFHHHDRRSDSVEFGVIFVVEEMNFHEACSTVPTGLKIIPRGMTGAARFGRAERSTLFTIAERSFVSTAGRRRQAISVRAISARESKRRHMSEGSLVMDG